MGLNGQVKFLTDVEYTELQFAEAHKLCIEQRVPYEISSNIIRIGEFGALSDGYFITFTDNGDGAPEELFVVPFGIGTTYIYIRYERATGVVSLEQSNSELFDDIDYLRSRLMKIYSFADELSVLTVREQPVDGALIWKGNITPGLNVRGIAQDPNIYTRISGDTQAFGNPMDSSHYGSNVIRMSNNIPGTTTHTTQSAQLVRISESIYKLDYCNYMVHNQGGTHGAMSNTSLKRLFGHTQKGAY